MQLEKFQDHDFMISKLNECKDAGTMLKQYDMDDILGSKAIGLSNDPVRDFLDYKFRRYYDGVDLDVSALVMWTYCQLYGWNTEDISSQGTANRNCDRYKIAVKYREYGGDTLTSAWTPLRCYVERLMVENKIEVPDNLKSVIDFNGEKLVYYSSAGDMITHLNRALGKSEDNFEAMTKFLSDILQGHDDALEFIKRWQEIGNFVVVPHNTINNKRSNGGKTDTADHLLWSIRNLFASNITENYLYGLFDHGYINWTLDCALSADKDWMIYPNGKMNGIHWMGPFIEANLLQDFVMDFDNGDFRPISFRKSTRREDGGLHKVAVDSINCSKDYKSMPVSTAEFENFFYAVNWCIKARSKRIYNKLGI